MSSRTTVAQLRDALRAKGLDATGNKAELLARLERASGPSEGATTTTNDNATTKTKRTRSPAGKTRAAAPTRSTRPLKRHAPALVLLLALTLLVSKVYFPNSALGVLATRAKPHLIRAMRLPMRVFGGADDDDAKWLGAVSANVEPLLQIPVVFAFLGIYQGMFSGNALEIPERLTRMFNRDWFKFASLCAIALQSTGGDLENAVLSASFFLLVMYALKTPEERARTGFV